jgi:hypothetical protein
MDAITLQLIFLPSFEGSPSIELPSLAGYVFPLSSEVLRKKFGCEIVNTPEEK